MSGNMNSRALKINLEKSRVDVKMSEKYLPIQDVMAKYFGLQDGLHTFLKELSHPYKNWQFIVNEARKYSLSNFHDLKTHAKGPEAVRLYVEIYLEALEEAGSYEVKSDAFKNLYLLLQKIMQESDTALISLMPAIDDALKGIARCGPDAFSIIASNYYQLNRLAEHLSEAVPPGTDFRSINSLLSRYYSHTFSYWLSENDPLAWFEKEISSSFSKELNELFEPISHSKIQVYEHELNDISMNEDISSPEMLKRLLELPGYGDIVRVYRNIPQKISEVVSDVKLRSRDKLLSHFIIMNMSGLAIIHEENLREINRTITWIIGNEDYENILQLIQKTFGILHLNVQKYPESVLMCVLNMAKGVYKTDESDLVHFFNREVVRLGFQTPDFRGISDEWQIESNAVHVQNIRIWMEIIKLNPKWSQNLISYLIIHLSLYGVLIKDTDLFPRDVTAFLNGEIKPVYNLVKQLMRLFPAYFNDIGAEGQLRDISTRIDELCKRRDILIHFLRKQSHVESSNKIVSIIEAVFDFWRTKSKTGLAPYLPQDIFEQIVEEGPYIDGVADVINIIFQKGDLSHTRDLLLLDDDSFKQIAEAISETDKSDIERVALAISFYKLLNQKYCITYCDINDTISLAEKGALPGQSELREALKQPDSFRKLSGLLSYLARLNALILSSEAFEIREQIYRKRHIAAGIPSMYGSYHETKFDAMGLTFRLEATVNTLFEDLINNFNFDFITRATFYQIHEYLLLFKQALNIEGISPKEFERQLDLLENSLKIKLTTFSQYVDIFKGFAQVMSNIVNDHFNNLHKENLNDIAHQIQKDKVMPKYLMGDVDTDDPSHKIAEIFLRDTVASSLALQQLDLFLTKILSTLYKQAEKLPVEKHYLLLTYNPENIVTAIMESNNQVLDIVHLGNKALNLVKLKEMGLPVPPGFIITTEVFQCRELVESYPPANKNFRGQVDRHIEALERLTGKTFGNPDNPLLLSVRSGGVVSLPGMMDSYLNVGMNMDIVRGIIKQTGNEWFASDCYRRFLQSYGMSFGLQRDDFDAVINAHKEKYRVDFKKDFTARQMREVALAYREMVESRGIIVEETPHEQLYIAIHQVLESWNSEKARTYRKIIGISDDWGTSVTVQSMVFGNISRQAGSGVLFTHSPKFSDDLLRPWGDYTIGNQGEDVVSGLVATYPISVYQARMENRPEDYALERKFPRIYRGLRNIAKLLVYKNRWSPQDIEFTFDGPDKEDLHVLQTRDMEMRERKKYPSFESTAEMTERLLGHGIGVSGGAMSGRVVFTQEDIAYWRKNEPGSSVILVRGDTVPDDIKEIALTDGLLTARGGSTSHAAIVANRLEKTCVVGCTDLVSMEKDKKFILHKRVVKQGDLISIDGSEGSIYLGAMKMTQK
jgi:pyruvate,orthophosphate dikinase